MRSLKTAKEMRSRHEEPSDVEVYVDDIIYTLNYLLDRAPPEARSVFTSANVPASLVKPVLAVLSKVLVEAGYSASWKLERRIHLEISW
jgi:hypothetical protein